MNRAFGADEAPPRPDERGPLRAEAGVLERYRYLLRTAPPDAIEAAHAEAFARLTPAQRADALRRLSEDLSPEERAAGPHGDDPWGLARAATGAELRQPGSLERAFGAHDTSGAPGRGLLSGIAVAFLGSAVARQLLVGVGQASDVAGPADRTKSTEEDTLDESDERDEADGRDELPERADGVEDIGDGAD
ncbi:MAG TPA: hypothetical protein VFS43_10510 [Polyangiaceae bacterium]|nr:hypothetical protein [Polyangiaceae bacterium]